MYNSVFPHLAMARCYVLYSNANFKYKEEEYFPAVSVTKKYLNGARCRQNALSIFGHFNHLES